MRAAGLSPSEIARGRKFFSWFNLLNTVSFQLLSGNIITLYVLRLQGGSFLVGALAAFTSLSPVMVLAGRPLVPRMKATTLMGVFWVLRYILMLPLLFSPAFSLTGFRELAISLVTLGVLGFNVARGIAITTFNPILAELAGSKDRGEYIAFIQLLINIAAPLVGIAMAVLLGAAAPLGMYAAFFAVGILSGLGASGLVFKLPEPVGFSAQVSDSLFTTLKKAFASRSFTRYIASLFAVFFVMSMAGPFLIVYLKEVYAAGDSYVVIITVIGGLGAIAMALASGLAIDRLGAKPLFFFFTAATTISLFPLTASPPLPSPVLLWIFSSGIFFLFSMGSSGSANAAQTYFFSITSSRENLNLGILYQLVTGVAGAAGSLAGGTFLSWLERITGWGATDVFRLFFGFIAVLSVVTLLLVSGLENIGAYSIRDSFGIIFSPRDMRALSLLRRLGRTRSQDEEESVIGELAQSQSEVSTEELLAKLKSPRFFIRSAALSALRALPTDERVNKALISEVREHPFTTAYMAAEMLGEKGVRDGIKALRQGLASQDFFLVGKCLVSLARLGDRESLPMIRSLVERTENPRLIIHGATALEIFRDAQSVGLLINKMRKRTSPYIREELILSLSGILGMQEWFYPLFSGYLEESAAGITRLLDFIETRKQEMSRDYSPLEELARNVPHKRKDFVNHAADVLERLEIKRDGADLSGMFVRSLDDTRLAGLPRYRFLLACAIVWFFFNP
jgi:MFS family permease